MLRYINRTEMSVLLWGQKHGMVSVPTQELSGIVLACVEKVSAQVRRESWDQSNDNLVEDDVICRNTSLNEDMIVAAKIAI